MVMVYVSFNGILSIMLIILYIGDGKVLGDFFDLSLIFNYVSWEINYFYSGLFCNVYLVIFLSYMFIVWGSVWYVYYMLYYFGSRVLVEEYNLIWVC